MTNKISVYTNNNYFKMYSFNNTTVESRSIVFEGDGENKRWMRKNDQSKYVVLSSSKVS